MCKNDIYRALYTSNDVTKNTFKMSLKNTFYNSFKRKCSPKQKKQPKNSRIQGPALN